ncbi:MAG: type IV secretion protein Rhs, partial [Chloroflexi bacterium]|nr:type IV secretion protein Rhs [Chloroflexota bacterium]
KKTGGDTAKGAFGAAEAVVVNRPVFTVDEASALATGLSNDIGRDFVQAEGLCRGNPGVKAGWEITIEGVGERFSGKYFVTRAMHVYNKDGYETTFSISGRQPNTLSHLLGSGNGHGDQARGLMRGVVTGLVTNLNDPDKLGRVKVKYDWLGNIESDWVRVASPMAGADRGFYYLPEVNDEVLLAFEQGDVHHPFVVGMLWSSKDKPPKPNDQVVGNGKVNERILKSRSGHVIILDDSEGQEKIIIRDKTEQNEIVIDSKENSLTINVGSDVVITAGGKVLTKSKGDIALESQANVSVKSQANLTLEATGQLKIKGNNVSIDGGPMTEIKGGVVKLN